MFIDYIVCFLYLDPNLYQGDIILTPAQREFLTKGQSKAFGSIRDVTKLWPNGVVPYTIGSNLRKKKSKPCYF